VLGTNFSLGKYRDYFIERKKQRQEKIKKIKMSTKKSTYFPAITF